MSGKTLGLNPQAQPFLYASARCRRPSRAFNIMMARSPDTPARSGMHGGNRAMSLSTCHTPMTIHAHLTLSRPHSPHHPKSGHFMIAPPRRGTDTHAARREASQGLTARAIRTVRQGVEACRGLQVHMSPPAAASHLTREQPTARRYRPLQESPSLPLPCVHPHGGPQFATTRTSGEPILYDFSIAR